MAEKEKKKTGLDRLLGLFESPGESRTPRDVRVGFAGEGPLLPAVAAAYAGMGLKTPPVYYHPDQEKARANGEMIGASKAVSDLAEFTARVDAVEMFAMPGRAEAVRKLLGAGRHVSLQKPFAQSLEEAEAMTRAAKRGEAILCVSEYTLFYEPYKKLKELIDTMEIGEVCAIRFRSNLAGKGGAGPWPELLEGREYFFHPAFDRHALAIHLLGGVDSVICYANNMRMDKGGQAIIGFKYKYPGCYGFFDLTYAPGTSIRADCIPCDDQVEVAGTDGIIWVNHFHGKMTEEPWIEVRRGKKHYSMGIGSDMAVEWRDCISAAARHFLDCAAGGRKPKYSLRAAKKALKFQLAAIEAAYSGGEVRV